MSRPNVRIRRAEPADVHDLLALISSVDAGSGLLSGRAPVEPDEAHICARLVEILDEGTRDLLVAVDEGVAVDERGAVVGLLVAKMDEIGALDVVQALHVTHLLVTPKHRRRGVGRALLAGAVHLAEERGVDRVLATAGSGSREANRYLARIGFAPLVVHRVASTATLRRSLGMVDASQRIAVLRRARLVRGQRGGLAARVVGRGA